MPQEPNLIEAVAAWLDSLPDKDAPISSTVEFKVKPSAEVAFVRNSEVLAAATRQQPGLDWYSYDKLQPDAPPPEAETPHQPTYGIIERWKSVREFQQQQWGSKHLTTFQAKLLDPKSGWLAGSPQEALELKFFYGSTVRTEVFSTGHDPQYPAERFQLNMTSGKKPVPDGTVTDTETDLVWLLDANAFNEVPWMHALQSANQLANGQCGLADGSQPGDWRLPNVNEMQSLLDLTNKSGVAIGAGHPFKNLEPFNYWTSSSTAAFPALAWYVAMMVGPPVFDLKINRMRMWPVRGSSARVPRTGHFECTDHWGRPIPPNGTGQDADKARFGVGLPWPAPRFQNNMTSGKLADGTVTDRLTGLTWLKNGDAFGTLNWQDAMDACDSLSTKSFDWLLDDSDPGEWRLPDVNELRTLEDYGRARPALPVGHEHFFHNIRQGLVWTRTEIASAPTLARFLYVGSGSCVWDHKSVLCGVWPVKGG